MTSYRCRRRRTSASAHASSRRPSIARCTRGWNSRLQAAYYLRARRASAAPPRPSTCRGSTPSRRSDPPPLRPCPAIAHGTGRSLDGGVDTHPVLRGNRQMSSPSRPRPLRVASRLLGGQCCATELFRVGARVPDVPDARAVDESHRALQGGRPRRGPPLGPAGEVVRRRRTRSGVDGIHPPGDLQLEREVEPNRRRSAAARLQERKSRPEIISVVRTPASSGEPFGGTLSQNGVSCRALPGSAPPAGGGSRRSRRARPARRRAPRASRRTARAARRGPPSAAPRRRRRGSAGGGSGSRRRPASRAGRAGPAPAHQRRQPGRTGVSRRERLHRAAMEELALDSAAFEHAPLGASSWSSRAASSAFSVGGTATSSPAGGHRHHLRDEQRVAARGVGDPLAQSGRDAGPDSASASSGGERLEPSAPASPGGAPRAPAGPCTGAGAARRPRAAPSLDQVEERLLAPLDVVEEHDERRLLLEQLPERPRDLVPLVPSSLAQQRADRRSGDRIRRQRASCFITSTTGQ